MNPRPSDYKSDALPTELRQHGSNRENITKGNINCKGTLWKTCANPGLLPEGPVSSPHSYPIFRATLEKRFYTQEAPLGNISFPPAQGAENQGMDAPLI